jgi:hypothetical protein
MTVIEHVYQEYKHQYQPKLTAPPETKRTASSNNFLDALCLVGVNVTMDDPDEAAPPMLVGELDHFLALDKSFGVGDREYPLLWWKVSLVPVIFLLGDSANLL